VVGTPRAMSRAVEEDRSCVEEPDDVAALKGAS
jgi:hypothetical protein